MEKNREGSQRRESEETQEGLQRRRKQPQPRKNAGLKSEIRTLSRKSNRLVSAELPKKPDIKKEANIKKKKRRNHGQARKGREAMGDKLALSPPHTKAIGGNPIGN